MSWSKKIYDPKWLKANECARLRRKYGITYDERTALLESQDFICAICGGRDVERELAVDHNHSTGKIRGMLCRSCNIGLGKFGDSPLLLRLAAEYLERN